MSYSLELKQEVLKRVLSKELKIEEARKAYGIGGKMTIYRWLERKEEILSAELATKDLKQDTSMGQSEDKEREATLEQEVARLRRVLKHERELREKEVTAERERREKEVAAERELREKESLRREAYEMMIEIAEDKFNIPIGKKSGTK